MTVSGPLGAPLPMFPLGTVLVPHRFLSLHVFEPRYRVLMFDCLRGDGEFGVVLIERGSEVGGDDQRFTVATVAHIVEATELPDGRWYVLAIGTRRVDVVEWLPDDPYPIAIVIDRPELPWPAAAGSDPAAAADPAAGAPTAGASTAPTRADTALAAAARAVRRLLVVAAEADGEPPAAPVELASDPLIAGWQLVAVAPLGALDKQGLLALDDPAERLGALAAMAEEQASLLAYRPDRE